ncbi:hypothetical protein [uncultured Leclercia sp.]|uniref:hypothetical protein n=1 Tax=uncultured Leclercia sp. TaxID=332959 RepID=UPI002598F88E|nr:hypothetical protein [uncultured Leclercia sp.]
MILQINFPDNLVTGLLSEQKNIPCTIKVSDKFEVIFSTVIPCTVGIIYEWDRQLLEERAIAKAGGVYTHNEPALITLNKKTEDSYEVVELHVFYNDFGWCPVIKDGGYAIPNQFWDSDEEDPDYIPKN